MLFEILGPCAKSLNRPWFNQNGKVLLFSHGFLCVRPSNRLGRKLTDVETRKFRDNSVYYGENRFFRFGQQWPRGHHLMFQSGGLWDNKPPSSAHERRGGPKSGLQETVSVHGTVKVSRLTRSVILSLSLWNNQWPFVNNWGLLWN